MANASGSGIQLINDLLLLHGQAGFLQIAEAQTGSDVTWTVQQASQQQPVTMPNPVVTAKIPALSLPTTKRKSPAKKHPLNANSIQKQHQLLSLPHARVRTIMKTAPNVSFLSQEAVLLAAKSAVRKLNKLWCGKRKGVVESSLTPITFLFPAYISSSKHLRNLYMVLLDRQGFIIIIIITDNYDSLSTPQ